MLKQAKQKAAGGTQENLNNIARQAPAPRNFLQALQNKKEEIALIAEIKRASPSRGEICPNLVPSNLGRIYQEGGASALSVLTENHFFNGSLIDLQEAREAVELPVLRKDFILVPEQVTESRLAGADALLLLAKILSPHQLKDLIEKTHNLGMAALVEVSDEDELEMSLNAGASIIGINHRDLHSFQIDLQRTSELAPFIPPEIPLVGESGIKNRQQVVELQRAGVKAVLVGETLVRSQNPADKIQELLGNKTKE